MAETFYPQLPVPGTKEVAAETTPAEILWSTVGLQQRGGVVAGGQGILPAGTVLGRVTSTKKWVVYADGASDGSEVARGILRDQIDSTPSGVSTDVMGNIVFAGMLKKDQLSGLDAAAITDLNGRSDTVVNLFAF